MERINRKRPRTHANICNLSTNPELEAEDSRSDNNFFNKCERTQTRYKDVFTSMLKPLQDFALKNTGLYLNKVEFSSYPTQIDDNRVKRSYVMEIDNKKKTSGVTVSDVIRVSSLYF
jgi:hypothetical protein